MNIYIWTQGGLCVSERLRCIQHDSVVGLTIEDIAILERELLPRFRKAQAGEGVSWIANASGVRSFCGFIPLPKDGLIVGISLLIERGTLDFLLENGIRDLPENRSSWDELNP